MGVEHEPVLYPLGVPGQRKGKKEHRLTGQLLQRPVRCERLCGWMFQALLGGGGVTLNVTPHSK